MLDANKLGRRKRDFEDYLKLFALKHEISEEKAKKEKIVKSVYDYYLEESKRIVVD